MSATATAELQAEKNALAAKAVSAGLRELDDELGPNIKQAKDDGYLPAYYSPKADNYNKNLVREQDFVIKKGRKNPDGSRRKDKTVIKRRGEAVYDTGLQAWTFRTVELVKEIDEKGNEVEVRGEVGEWYKVNLDHIDFI